MEILSTGEKIRRARIQKGMTLKTLCGDEISVSKMSTIENDKIQAEEWILDLVAERLGIKKDDLKKDIVQEINEELKSLSEKLFSKTYEKEIKNIISVCDSNGLSVQSFLAKRQLIDHYLLKSRGDELNVEIANLYSALINIVSTETLFLYFLTMGKYLYHSSEHKNALVFFDNLMLHFDVLPASITKETKLEIPLMAANCHIYLEEYDEAKKYISFIDELLRISKDDQVKGSIHLLYYLISSSSEASYDYKKVSDYLANYPEIHARAKYFIAVKLLTKNDFEGAYREMREASQIFPEDKYSDNVELLLDAMERFVDSGHFEEASKYIDLIVNSAIENKNPITMEKAYYYKGLLLSEKGSYDMAETYMSVSLDMLIKRGKSSKLAKRYRDLGDIYYKMGKKEEAIKHYTTSINIKNNSN